MSTDSFNNERFTELKQFIKDQDEALEIRVENKARKWWMAQIASLLPIIFLLGGIYVNGNNANTLLNEHQMELNQRGKWMQDREKWEQAIESQWGDEEFKAPRYTRKMGG